MTKCVKNHQKKQLKTIIISLLRWHHHCNSSGSAEWRQSEESWLEFFYTLESQSGLLCEAGVHVVVRNHHHLHSRCQCRLDTIGSVFKDQTLGKDIGEEKKRLYPVSLLGLQDSSPRAGITLLWVEKQSRKMGISAPSCILVWWTWHFLRVIAFSFVSWDIHSIYNKQSGVPWICVLPKSEAVLFVIHIFLWCCTPFTNKVSMPTVVGWFSMPGFSVLSPYRAPALVTNSTN